MALQLLQRFRSSANVFELNLKYLFLVGLWPEENLTSNQMLLYKIYKNTLHCFSVIFIIITGVKTYQIRDDLIPFLANIDKLIATYNYFFKIIYFTKKRNELKALVDDIFFSGDKVNGNSRKDMINHLLLITGFNSGLMMIFSMIGLYYGEMTVDAWMPFDPKKSRMNLLLSAQILAVIFCVPFSYRAIGIQGIVCSILIYLCDQLAALQDEIKTIDYSKDETRARLSIRRIIMKHIRLMRYANSMERMFKEYFLIQHLAITMELCLNAMMVTVIDTTQKTSFAGFLGFLGLALLNAYIYCHLGNKLIEQSAGMAFAAYSSNWTTWPVDIQKNILLIISVASRPLKMSAGGIIPVSMETYSSAIYNGYSIFAVLSDVVDNK